MKLNLVIEDLISQNSSDFEVSKAIKDEIKTYIKSLNIIFEKDQGKHFLVKHTKRVDAYIKVIFKYALRKHFGEYQPLINTLPITVVSLGSYAREQLCVYSDIDLMIVFDKVEGYNLEPIIETILQVAWDSGLKLGHRVHLLEDLHKASLEDHTIKTALIESRYLCGSRYLWMHVENELKKIRRDNTKEFVIKKIQERKERLKKHPFSMEADIKSSAGGLRDLNTLYWISNALYNIIRVKDLTPYIILESEYSKLMSSIEFIYRVRVALHLSADKKQDKLLMEYIPDVAKKLHLPQRRLVEKTFDAMVNVQLICEFLIKKVTHHLFYEHKNFATIKNARLEKSFYYKQNILCTPLHVNRNNISNFIDNFLTLEDKNPTFDITYIHALQIAKKDEIDPAKIKMLFNKRYLYNFFMATYRAKQLYRLIPPMKKIAHLPQFDGYHKYPVDIHSIQTLLALEEINDVFVKKVFESFTKEEKALLRATAFLHDCGKGRRKDHSLLGASIVKKYLQELGFSHEETNQAAKLVKFHTLMSNIANREDIYSDKVVFTFIAKLKDIKTLELLYVLTYADIESVGKGTYSSFNAKLLHELYELAREAFLNKKRITDAQKRIKKERQLLTCTYFKTLSRMLQKKILSIESNLLFFKYTSEEITNIATWVNKLDKPYDYKITCHEALSIEIIRQEDLNLGYLLGKIPNLNVITMDIFKIFNSVKYFRLEFSDCVDEEDIFLLEEIIQNSFDMQKSIHLTKPQILKSAIDIDCNHSKTYARMTLMTKDSPLLLANIMATFDDIGIDIASAKIQTIKNRARNLFLLEKNGKFCNNQEEVIKRLTTKE